MEEYKNNGYDPAFIQELKARMAKEGKVYVIDKEGENADEYVHFQFIGKKDDREVIFDTALYTLRLHHESELFEIAENRAAKHFPDYQKIVALNKDDDDPETRDDEAADDPLTEEIGLFMAEVIVELEEEGSVKVREHVDRDEMAEFGIGLDVGLHVEKITPMVIERFIADFNAGALKLDETLYSFLSEDDGE